MIVIGLDTASDRWHASIRTVRQVNQTQPRTPELRCRKIVHKGETKGLNADERRTLLANSFDDLLDEVITVASMTGDVVHVFCEESLALANGKTTRVLGLAAGALWDRHCRYDLFWHWVNVSQWAKMAGINTGKDKTPTRKKKSRDFAMKHGAPKGVDQDHYDADNCALYGIRELGRDSD